MHHKSFNILFSSLLIPAYFLWSVVYTFYILVIIILLTTCHILRYLQLVKFIIDGLDMAIRLVSSWKT